MYIDTHSHINFSVFRDDVDQVIRNAIAEKTWMVVVGTDYRSSKKALEHANKYEKGVYATVGLHPAHLFESNTDNEEYDSAIRGEEFNYDIYEKLAKFEKVVAIGEIGLDYYHIDKMHDTQLVKAKQKEAFCQQLLLARHLDLPVIIHCRQAHDDMISILDDFKKEYRNIIPVNRSWGVVHCFSGDENLAWKYFNLGLMISFTGLITFSSQWDDLIRRLPSDKYMIETDCPFMTPEPHRGKRNEPVFVEHVAGRIAQIKGLPKERIAEITTNNARALFKI